MQVSLVGPTFPHLSQDAASNKSKLPIGRYEYSVTAGDAVVDTEPSRGPAAVPHSHRPVRGRNEPPSAIKYYLGNAPSQNDARPHRRAVVIMPVARSTLHRRWRALPCLVPSWDPHVSPSLAGLSAAVHSPGQRPRGPRAPRSRFPALGGCCCSGLSMAASAPPLALELRLGACAFEGARVRGGNGNASKQASQPASPKPHPLGAS